MDKFKIELTWHNCKRCPPKETYNPYLIYTNGYVVEACAYYKQYGFPIIEDELEQCWWADIRRTIRESNKFEELRNEMQGL